MTTDALLIALTVVLVLIAGGLITIETAITQYRGHSSRSWSTTTCEVRIGSSSS